MAGGQEARIAPASGREELEEARGLFREYVASLGVDLAFQDIAAELGQLPGKYAPPGGVILLAWSPDGRALGCAALRPLAEPATAEMKRLYVRAGARGQDLGRRLAEAVIAWARAAGYRRIRLDTLEPMRAAQALYARLGFRPTEAYYDNPLPGTRYMSLDL
ncbi:GNAT family N-acetyltransferase [Roseomonas marmotae]|uniref:GNAT family N-acetyltransferase n=1 Tax=Roseomonas marmotae TaxID=2768161 RepID=A0ABS3K931_9PROT|nr:GNAT family N-acetyltransferase [Roseomonas marmotae]MBO1073979.1 GNAT family N-acetyltransferase [Roseomonas marmotae]QTI78771.1 GNAT family N-acetyltransferase [Roseomonas marmotae]